VRRHDGGGAVLGVDAPLVVTVTSGRRDCEGRVQAAYGRRGAGPHPSNLTLLRGRVRAMELVRSLGYTWRLEEPAGRTGRWAIEVFPHPALVELAGLDRALRYKRGPLTLRREGLLALLGVLQRLGCVGPTLLALGSRLGSLRGGGLKDFEDLADAHVCALVARHWWRHGRIGTRVFGDEQGGAILVPVPVHEGLWDTASV
jgi:predicted RNase H-like nuclease